VNRVMDSEKRREEIIRILSNKAKPVKGIELANKFNVTRQIIVQDIALLRAKGENIISTPQGYLVINMGDEKKCVKAIVCRHHGYSAMEDELKSIVDMGGKVLDVIVEHKLYGEIKSPLMIGSRLDVDNFIESFKKTNSEPLSSLTDGIHIHSIEADNEEIIKKIEELLDQKGYLIK